MSDNVRPAPHAEPSLDQSDLARSLLVARETTLAILGQDGDLTGAPLRRAKALLAYTDGAADIERAIRLARAALSSDAVLWIAYPDAAPSAHVARSVLTKTLGLHGLEPTFEVTVDRHWSAVLARPAAPRTPMLPRAVRLARRARRSAARRPA